MSKHICFPILAILLVLFAFWASGYDFDQRGFKAVLCIIMCVMFGLFGFIASIQK